MASWKQAAGLVVCMLAVFMVAFAGALASSGAGSFYEQLELPAWSPPGWLFGPVWTVLYILIGLSAWLVWREGGFRVHAGPLKLFILQLAANGLWPWLFFTWHQGALAFGEILLLLVLVAATVIAFLRVRLLAGIILFPYLAWVLFAVALAFSAWRLNPEVL